MTAAAWKGDENMESKKEWWRGCVIYQVYPRSFMDANGDGIGDLAGITANMNYIADLGVDAIWLSPFFRSPMRDFGYDVSDFLDVDPIFGTLKDYDALVAAAHKRGLKVFIDQVISHTSNRHSWFVESMRNRDNPKADWYVWADPRPDGTPPNNWLSNFGGPAWEWSTSRMQYYLHNFLASQPDLNFHHPEVRAAALDVLRFWLDRGTDGFRLDTVNYYFHDQQLRDNPPWPRDIVVATAPATNPYSFQDHVYSKTRPENLTFLEDLRKLMDSYPERALVGELGVDGPAVGPSLATYTEEGRRLHMAYVFELLTADHSPAYIRAVVERLNREIGSGWICWSLSNHDVERVVTRWGYADRAERAGPLLWALVHSLRGSVGVYQGEELGLTEADIPYDRIQDPYGKAMWPEFKGRDGCRTPMPWSRDALNAGFSNGQPWLPIPEEHRSRAALSQTMNSDSCLSRCRRFTKWRRKQPLLLEGDIAFIDVPGDILCFAREKDGSEIVAAFNLGREETTFSLPGGKIAPLEGHGFTGKVRGNTITLGGLDAAFCRR